MEKEIWCLVPPDRGQGELLSLQKKIRFISPLSLVFDPFILLGYALLPEKDIEKIFMELGNLSIFKGSFFEKGNLCLPYDLNGLNKFLGAFEGDFFMGEKGSFILAFNIPVDSQSYVKNLSLDKALIFHTFSLQKWRINFRKEEWIEWEKEIISYKRRT